VGVGTKRLRNQTSTWKLSEQGESKGLLARESASRKTNRSTVFPVLRWWKTGSIYKTREGDEICISTLARGRKGRGYERIGGGRGALEKNSGETVPPESEGVVHQKNEQNEGNQICQSKRKDPSGVVIF